MSENEAKNTEGEVNGESDGASAEKQASGGRSRGQGGNRDRKRRDRRDRREPKEKSPFTETLIDIYRCSATVKGGRRMSFGALVTVGNGKGRVGIGYAKAKEVPGAIQKAIKKGQADLKSFIVTSDGSIPHQVVGRFGASKVILVPARPGTGVIAGAAVKAILEAGGLKNVLTKSIGNPNTRNIVKATMNALEQLRSPEFVAKLRGVEL